MKDLPPEQPLPWHLLRHLTYAPELKDNRAVNRAWEREFHIHKDRRR